MNDKQNTLQTDFLRRLYESKGAATIFLVNGVKLQGIVTASDDATVLLRREAHEQLIYKHAISTIMPHAKVCLVEDDDLQTAEEDA